MKLGKKRWRDVQRWQIRNARPHWLRRQKQGWENRGSASVLLGVMYSPSWRVQKNHCSVDLVMSVPLRGKLGSNETLILMWFFSKTDEKKNDRFSFCKRSTYSWRLWNYRDAFQFYTVFHPQIVFAFCVYTLSDLVGCLEEAPSRQLTWRTLREVQSKTKASVAS